MIRNTYGNRKVWVFPGGAIDKGESEEEAFRREILEEVGVEISHIQKIGNFISTKEFKKDHVTVFKSETINKSLHIDTDEILEAKWIRLNEIQNPTALTQKMLGMYKESL